MSAYAGMLFCMRTTLNLDDDLVRAAKNKALHAGTTLTSVIEEALRAALAEREVGVPLERYEVPVISTGGLMPGVDLDDSAGLLEILESDGTWH
jgi:hypothetical protein